MKHGELHGPLEVEVETSVFIVVSLGRFVTGGVGGTWKEMVHCAHTTRDAAERCRVNLSVTDPTWRVIHSNVWEIPLEVEVPDSL